MPIHTVNQIAELVPETRGLVKRASLEQNLPTGSKDETLVSALELEYMTKVAHTHVDLSDVERVCKAVDLYGLADDVRAHTGTMVKAASIRAKGVQDTSQEVMTATNFIDTQLLSMNPDMEKIAEASEALWDSYESYISNDKVRVYAGAGTLVKEAALAALSHRSKRTGNTEFEKIAQVIQSTDVSKLTVEDNRAIVNAIKGLEKDAHYIESDIYTDIFMSKEASVMVNLCGRSVNADDLVQVAGNVSDIAGADIGALLQDAHANKDAIEALPLGEKQLISGLV